MPSSLTSFASSNGTFAISGGLRRLTTVVTPRERRSRSPCSVGWPLMKTSSPALENFSWKNPGFSSATGAGTPPVGCGPVRCWAAQIPDAIADITEAAAASLAIANIIQKLPSGYALRQIGNKERCHTFDHRASVLIFRGVVFREERHSISGMLTNQ